MKENVLRRVPLERQLALSALIYTWIALVLWPEEYTEVLTYYMAMYVVFVPPLLAAGLLTTSLITRPFSPLSFVVALLRDRGRQAPVVLAVSCMSVAAFTTYKSQIVVPFFADELLADLDEALHFGQPWRLAHALVSHHFSTAMTFVYSMMWLLQCLGCVIIGAFLRDRILRERYFVSLVASMFLLGTVFRILASSAGPIFYDRLFEEERFLDLIATLSSHPVSEKTLAVSNYLYESYSSEKIAFGAGISAMPSMHVAIAVLNAAFLSHINRWLGVYGWAYAGAILFGSVYFGWHYALDGYVSVFGVLLIWTVARRRRGQSQLFSPSMPTADKAPSGSFRALQNAPPGRPIHGSNEPGADQVHGEDRLAAGSV